MRSIALKTCTIALVTALSVPAFAQGTTGSGGGAPGSAGSTTAADITTSRDNRGFDWGWLGLLGLVGLMGLRRQTDGSRLDTTPTSAQR